MRGLIWQEAVGSGCWPPAPFHMRQIADRVADGDLRPTSVTPFSSRARDKGLAGVLASLVRQGGPNMAPE